MRSIINKISSKIAAINNSPQSPPLNEQVPQQMRIGIEILLNLDMPEPELSAFPVAGDPRWDNCLGLFYRVDVDALKTRAKKKLILCQGVLGIWWRSLR